MICGILFCYNEEHIISECLEYYLNQDIDIVVIDNLSTDSSVEIVKRFQKNEKQFPGKILYILSVKTDGYEWQKILHFACSYMHEHLSKYEWIMLIDADSFYYSPVNSMPLTKFMETSKKYGYNIINGQLFDFYPTEKDDPTIISHTKRLRYYQTYTSKRNKKIYLYRKNLACPQHKIFLYHPTIDFYTHYGHICLRENPKISPVNFFYNHYPWVSYEHGLKKIFKERKPRFVERKTDPLGHPQYLGLLPIKKDLIRASAELKFYDRKKVSISRLSLFLKFNFSSSQKILVSFKKPLGFLGKPFFKAKSQLENFKNIFIFYGRKSAFNYLFSVFRKTINFSESSRKNSEFASNTKDSHNNQKFFAMNFKETLKQQAYAEGLPNNLHFLTTNFCNARCTFCNQILEHGQKKSLTLKEFKTILGNIPPYKNISFTFSGGGEPLLCNDLFSIINHAKNSVPCPKIHIRTNGLLIKKHLKELIQSGMDELEISLHGATAEKNSAILQIKTNDNIFEDIACLKNEMRICNNKMRIAFCVAVSQNNIEELPAIVKRASDIGIDKIVTSFRRYYIDEYSCEKDIKSSLFFNKTKYNEIILESRKISKLKKIEFTHEPIFYKKNKPRPCLQPWEIMLIDWNGNIYPCTGGEICFAKQIQSGQYNFGNLLTNHISECWNNESYLKLRRTCSRFCGENFMPECKNCHNTICLKGPDYEYGHIIKAPAHKH